MEHRNSCNDNVYLEIDAAVTVLVKDPEELIHEDLPLTALNYNGRTLVQQRRGGTNIKAGLYIKRIEHHRVPKLIVSADIYLSILK